MKALYEQFRRYDHKRRIAPREHLFDAIVEVLALFSGVTEARPPDDDRLERIKRELERRTFDALQQARDKLTIEGLRIVRDDALPADLLELLEGTGITTPGHLLYAIRDRSLDEEKLKAVLDYLGLQRKGGRPPKRKDGEEHEHGGEAGGDSG